jgi:hypothetical protein
MFVSRVNDTGGANDTADKFITDSLFDSLFSKTFVFRLSFKKNESWLFSFFQVQNHYGTCSLCFENNLLTVGHFRFALKTVFLLSNVFASL